MTLGEILFKSTIGWIEEWGNFVPAKSSPGSCPLCATTVYCWCNRNNAKWYFFSNFIADK